MTLGGRALFAVWGHERFLTRMIVKVILGIWGEGGASAHCLLHVRCAMRCVMRCAVLCALPWHALRFIGGTLRRGLRRECFLGEGGGASAVRGTDGGI